MQISSSIIPCLWFDRQGEDAARFYTSVFPDSGIDHIERFPPVGQEVHGQPAGLAMTVSFRLGGQQFTALNGGPQFRFTEAVSFQVMCDSQEEVDHYWSRLGEGGPVEAQQCGWLKDKFGLSWQIIPKRMIEMLSDADKAKSQRAFAAMMNMKKLDLPALESAFNGNQAT
jgi:predicted 3-demethylubiquinone-9 3-methyltransferase (glyoxalase superfamily)